MGEGKILVAESLGPTSFAHGGKVSMAGAAPSDPKACLKLTKTFKNMSDSDFSKETLTSLVGPLNGKSHELRKFANFTVNLTKGEIFKNGVKFGAELKQFQMLALLLQAPGQLITFDELKAVIWPDAKVELKENCHVSANKVRVSLGESEDGKPFIVNERGKGYYFNPQVDVECLVVSSELDVDIPALPTAMGLSRRWSLVAGGLVVLAGIGYTANRIGRTPRRPGAWRPAGKTLAVFSEDGHELWRHTFPWEIDSAGIDAHITGTGRPACVFADLDGDGRVEILFRHSPSGPAVDQSMLFCFSAEGENRGLQLGEPWQKERHFLRCLTEGRAK